LLLLDVVVVVAVVVIVVVLLDVEADPDLSSFRYALTDPLADEDEVDEVGVDCKNDLEGIDKLGLEFPLDRTLLVAFTLLILLELLVLLLALAALVLALLAPNGVVNPDPRVLTLRLTFVPDEYIDSGLLMSGLWMTSFLTLPPSPVKDRPTPGVNGANTLLSEPREPTLPTSSNDEAEAVCESP
jgi:hypothetical protein